MKVLLKVLKVEFFICICYILITSLIYNECYSNSYHYVISELQQFDHPDSLSFTTIQDLNNAGEIVGSFDNKNGKDIGFLYKNNKFSDFDYPGSYNTSCRGINNLSHIVGFFHDLSGMHNFIYKDLNFEVPSYSYEQIQIRDINTAGQFVGVYYDGSKFKGYISDGNSFNNLIYPNSLLTTPNCINDSGEIVGSYEDINNVQHGFYYKNNSFTTIDYPDCKISYVSAISDTGIMVGNFSVIDNEHHQGYVYIDNKFIPIHYPDSAESYAIGINNSKQVVGNFRYIGEYIFHGFTTKIEYTENQCPKAEAGSNQRIFEKIVIDGSNSYDPDGTIVSYEWSLTCRGNPLYNKKFTGVKVTVENLEPGFFDIKLTVTDDSGCSNSDEIVVLSDIGILGDINNDRKIGLEETIFSLQSITQKTQVIQKSRGILKN